MNRWEKLKKNTQNSFIGVVWVIPYRCSWIFFSISKVFDYDKDHIPTPCVCTNRVQSWRSSYIMEYNPNQYVWKAIYMCRWCANYLLIRTEELCDQLLRRVHFFLIDFWCSLTIYFDFGCQYIILWNRISFSIFPLIRKPTLRLHLYSLCFIRHVLWETTHNKFTEMSYKSQRYSWARRN